MSNFYRGVKVGETVASHVSPYSRGSLEVALDPFEAGEAVHKAGQLRQLGQASREQQPGHNNSFRNM